MKRFDVQVDDIATLRKPHPCGGYKWRVTRIGADIGLKCLICGRHIMMPRSKFNRRAKEVVSGADFAED